MSESWQRIPIPEADVIQWRRHIHAHPELSYKEFETSDYVAETLTRFGGIAIDRLTKTSVAGTLRVLGSTSRAEITTEVSLLYP